MPLVGSPPLAASRELGTATKGDLILVVDDDRDIREVTADILTTAGYSVVTACDGRQALELLRSIRPALILLDLNMPNLDGADFRQQQRRDPDWIQIPTVLVSAANIEPLLELACAACLRKPVKLRELLAVVGRFCAPAPSRAARQRDPELGAR